MSTQPRKPAAAKAAPPTFDPVPVRPRKDGWTPDKQILFIETLAATGSVTQACRRVGMSKRAAFDLYHRRDAESFRTAWGMAVQHCNTQLSTALLSRALHGTATPIFYKGEQIGERRTFDNRLAMWMLARTAPERFGAWRDGFVFRQNNPDAATGNLHKALRNLAADLIADSRGEPRERRAPQQTIRFEEDDRSDTGEENPIERKIALDLFYERMELIKRGEIDPRDPEAYSRWEAEQGSRRTAARRASGSEGEHSAGDAE